MAAMEFCSVSRSESRMEDAEEDVVFRGRPLCSARSGRGDVGFCQREEVVGMRAARFVDSKGLVRKMSRGYCSVEGAGVCDCEPKRKV